MRNKQFGALAIIALLTMTAAAMPAQSTRLSESGAAEQLPPEVLFAQRFVRALRDSGAVGVIPMTVPRTRALKGYAPNMDALRDDLAPPQATVTLDRWSAAPAKGEAPPLFLVTFKVEGVARPVVLSLYVEQLDGQYLMNTVMTRALASNEHLYERQP